MIGRESTLLMATSAGSPPAPIVIQYSNLVFAQDNRVARMDDTGIELSLDEGETYTRKIPLPLNYIRSDIRLVHVFSNERAICATHQKVYYTADWITWQESTIIGVNGQSWVRELEEDNFTTFNGTRKFNINGVESLLFSNYNNSENGNMQTTAGIGYIWFTNDFGQNIRAIYQLGVTLPFIARHIHSVSQDPWTNQIYFDTGDEVWETNSHWGRGTYDANNNFTWEHLGAGGFRKTTGIFFDEQYIYGVLDHANGGLIRYVRGQEGNTANVQQVLQTINDCAGAIFGKNGDCCVHQLTWNSYDAGHVLWYSVDKLNWTRIVVAGEDLPAGWNFDTVFVKSFEPTTSGKALAMVQINGKTAWPQFLMEPSVWINQILAKYGFPNAFK